MTTFKQALKNDLTRITPAPELLSRVSEIMREEAQKPRVSPLKMTVRFAGMAAAVTILAFGTVRFLGNVNTELPAPTGSDATANDAGAVMPMNDSAEIADENRILYFAEDDSEWEEPTDGQDSGGMSGAAQTTTAASAAQIAPLTTAFPRGQFDWDGAPAEAAAANDVADEAPAGAAAADSVADVASAETAAGVPVSDEARDDAERPSGGDERASYFMLFDWKLASIDGGLIEIVGEEAFEEWRIGKESFGCTTDPSENMNLYALILDFPEHKAAMEARLHELAEIDRKNGWNVDLTEEEIELFMNGEKDEIFAYFVSPAAVYQDGKIYSPEWLDTHTVADYEAENLPKDQLREKLDEILWLSNVMDLTSLAEKLSEYLGETVTVPEWTEPARTADIIEEAIPEDIPVEVEDVPEEVEEVREWTGPARTEEPPVETLPETVPEE